MSVPEENSPKAEPQASEHLQNTMSVYIMGFQKKEASGGKEVVKEIELKLPKLLQNITIHFSVLTEILSGTRERNPGLYIL